MDQFVTAALSRRHVARPRKREFTHIAHQATFRDIREQHIHDGVLAVKRRTSLIFGRNDSLNCSEAHKIRRYRSYRGLWNGAAMLVHDSAQRAIAVAHNNLTLELASAIRRTPDGRHHGVRVPAASAFCPALMRSNFTTVALMRSEYSSHVGGWRQPHRGSASPP